MVIENAMNFFYNKEDKTLTILIQNVEEDQYGKYLLNAVQGMVANNIPMQKIEGAKAGIAEEVAPEKKTFTTFKVKKSELNKFKSAAKSIGERPIFISADGDATMWKVKAPLEECQCLTDIDGVEII